MNRFQQLVLLVAAIVLGVLIALAYAKATGLVTQAPIVPDTHSYCVNVDRPNPICDGKIQ